MIFLDELEVKNAIIAGEKATGCPRCKKSEYPKHVKVSYWESADYWFERQFAPVKEQRDTATKPIKQDEQEKMCMSKNFNEFLAKNGRYTPLGANLRGAFLVNTSKTKEKHFATYPVDLCVPFIRAGCPKEICTKCGLPRYPVVTAEGGTGKSWHEHQNDLEEGFYQGNQVQAENWTSGKYKRQITYTSCGCGAPFVPGVVFDPFFGTGTTAVAAIQEHRQWVGTELSPQYIKFAEKRLGHLGCEIGSADKKWLARKVAGQGLKALEAFGDQ